MKNFIKYPSLINSGDFTNRHYLKWKDVLTQDFYATEKLHGSNFSIYYDGEEFTFARRTDFLSNGEELFQHKDFFKDYDLSFIKNIYDTNTFTQIIVYGEFYGDGIQKMEYKENLEGVKNFKIFNVLGQVDEKTFIVFGYKEMLENVGEERTAPYINKGSIWDLLKTLDMDAESSLGGISEGYVIQPYDTRSYVTGGFFYGVKHKTAAFSETKTVFNDEHIKKAQISEQLENYVTANRLNNVISKGEVEPTLKNIGILIDLMLDDVFSEFTEPIPVEEVNKYRNGLKRSVALLIKQEISV